MKHSISLFLRISLLILLAGATACRRGNQQDDIVYGDLPPVTDFDSFDGTALPDGRMGIDSMSPVDSSSLAPVYFAYDSSTLSPSEMSKVSSAAARLRSDSGLALILQGHSDERGSREYNLALGERRALAVRDVLLSMGISTGRIQTLSYGEEMPAVEGFDESAWSLNRRVEFQLMR
jgi:peptidoglycan-associated lipoprotein